MRDRGIGDVIVVDGESAAGIVTDRDIVIRGIAEAPMNTARLSRSCRASSVAPDDPVEQAIAVMREKAIRRVPVLEGGKPIGVLSLGDLAIERDERSVLADISEEPPDR